MKTRFWLFTSMLIILISSCTDIYIGGEPNPDYTTPIKVYVVTNTGEPISGFTPTLKCSEGGFMRMSNGIKTDTNGMLAFVFEGPQSATIKAGHYGSYSYCYSGYDYFQPYFQMNHTIRLTPRGWIKLKIKNVNPMSPDDLLSVRVSTLSVGFNGLADKTEVFRTGANGVKDIYWTVYKNNETTKYQDTIYIPTEDTAYFEILY